MFVSLFYTAKFLDVLDHRIPPEKLTDHCIRHFLLFLLKVFTLDLVRTLLLAKLFIYTYLAHSITPLNSYHPRLLAQFPHPPIKSGYAHFASFSRIIGRNLPALALHCKELKVVG